MSSKKMTPDKPAEAMKPITNKEEKSSAPKVTKATSKEASKPSSDKEGKLPVKKEEKAPLKEGARPAPAKAEKSSAKKSRPDDSTCRHNTRSKESFSLEGNDFLGCHCSVGMRSAACLFPGFSVFTIWFN